MCHGIGSQAKCSIPDVGKDTDSSTYYSDRIANYIVEKATKQSELLCALVPMRIAPLALAVSFLAGPSAFAASITYVVNLSGPNEAPPNGSPGTGFATIIID